MTTYVLVHRHASAECAVVFAAWSGFASPLRGQPVWTSCLGGGHRLWWRVEARDEAAALALLPAYVASRTEAIPVRQVFIP